MTRNRLPDPPRHLRPSTKAWFRVVVAQYELEDHHVKLLSLAAEAWDRAEAARAALAKHGLTFIDRFECPRSRPEVGIAKDATIAFARLLRELDLDGVPPPSRTRPPAIPSNRENL